MNRFQLRFLAAAAAALALSACGADAPKATERVAIFVLDATHRDHVGAYGGPEGLTPTLDLLAGRSMRFERPFSNANWTLPSTACLMTGRLQEEHGVVSRHQRVRSEHVLLPELFADAGFHTAGYSQMPYASETYGFGRGFDEFHYYGNGRESEARAGGLTIFENAGRWMRALEGEKWFSYVHLRRPHSPYDAPRKLLARLDPDGPLADGSQDATLRVADTFAHRALLPDQAERVRVLYRANLMAVDRAVGWLIAIAERQGALVIVTSDHGEALGVDDTWGHGISVAADNIDIPLLVHGPEVAQGVSDHPAATIDLLPTLVELCDLELPSGFEPSGTSLAGLLTRGAAPPAVGPRLSTGKHGFGEALQVAVVDGDLKLVLEGDGSTRLFDRRSDPGERLDLSAERPDEAVRLGDLARAWRAEHVGLIDANRVDAELDDALRADLERLGYVTDDGDDGSAAAPSPAVEAAPDAPGGASDRGDGDSPR